MMPKAESCRLIVSVMLLTLLNGCSESDPEQGNLDGGGMADREVIPSDGGDSGVVDLQFSDMLGQDMEPICGPGVYPCGPYGTKVGNTLKKLSFQGFADPQHLCKPFQDQEMDTSKLIDLSMQHFHQGDPACTEPKKELLWIMVGAGWCELCVDEVKEVEALFVDGQLDSRVVPLSVIIGQDTLGSIPDEDFLRLWADNPRFKLTFPIAMDPHLIMGNYMNLLSVPGNLLVELETMTILAVGIDFDASDMLAAIAMHLQ